MNKTIVIEGSPIGENRKPGDVGYDIKASEDMIVMHGERTIIKTNHKVKLPYETEEQIRPRSNMSAKGMEAFPCRLIERKQWKDSEGNFHVEHIYEPRYEYTDRFDADVKIGTVDPDYPNTVGAIVTSQDSHTFLVPKDTRIAQVIFNEVVIPQLLVGTVDENNNRNGGFGTSGNK